VSGELKEAPRTQRAASWWRRRRAATATRRSC